MQYRAFKYLVMPFGLTNTPSAFQFFMNDIFHDMVDICMVIYLDNILIFSNNEEECIEHVRKVLQCLWSHHLYAKPEKCDFHTHSIKYLGMIISPDSISMDPSKVSAILAWPVLTNIWELQLFLGFANFYRQLDSLTTTLGSQKS
jgi:hypothetical protein